MSAPESVDLLLSRWQQQVRAGHHLSPEELCRDRPELLDELRRCIENQQRIEKLTRWMHEAGAGRPDEVTVSAAAGTPAGRGYSGATAPLPELPGYDLLRRLGKGGMGVVYEARDQRLGRLVAIKMLRDEEGDPTRRDRLLREARAAASLNHPNIVQVFAVGEHQGRPFLVMELVNGPNLHQVDRPFVPRDAARLVFLLSQAVQVAHDRKIVHRDLKPSNVLLAPAAVEPALNGACGCPKIADFGLACWLDAEHGLTRTGDAAGTPSYMAPEQAQGRLRDIGAVTDVYGLGAILYELLTRRPPFTGNTFAAILEPLLYDDPVAPRRLQPDVPADLETICLKCLQKAAGRRYPSAAALAADLGRFLRGEPIQARPVGPLEQAWKWARREPLLVLLGGAILAALLLAIVALAYGWHQSEWVHRLEAQRAADAEKRRKDEEQLYQFQVQIADRELADERLDLAERALDQCPPPLRRWEWYHLRQRCRQPQVAALRGHTGPVTCVAAAVRGTRFASAGADGWVCIWEPERQTPVQQLAAHTRAVNGLAWTADDTQLISAGADHKILLWDVATGGQRHFAAHDGPVFCLAAHPTQPWVASTTFEGGQAGDILLWDRQTLQVVRRLRGHGWTVTGLAFSADGQRLASSSHDGTVRLWNPQDGTVVRIFRDHSFPVACVAFSPDAQLVASAAGPLVTPRDRKRPPTDNEIFVWSARDGTIQRQMRGDFSRTVTLAFAPQGDRLGTGGWTQRIKIWDCETTQEILRLGGHTETVTGLAFLADGTLISGSVDGTVRLWPAPAPARAPSDARP